MLFTKDKRWIRAINSPFLLLDKFKVFERYVGSILVFFLNFKFSMVQEFDLVFHPITKTLVFPYKYHLLHLFWGLNDLGIFQKKVSRKIRKNSVEKNIFSFSWFWNLLKVFLHLRFWGYLGNIKRKRYRKYLGSLIDTYFRITILENIWAPLSSLETTRCSSELSKLVCGVGRSSLPTSLVVFVRCHVKGDSFPHSCSISIVNNCMICVFSVYNFWFRYVSPVSLIRIMY